MGTLSSLWTATLDKARAAVSAGVQATQDALSGPGAAASQDRQPDPGKLQAGDFVWPKKPGAYVPYGIGGPVNPAEDANEWMRLRDAYIGSVNPNALDDLARQRLSALRTMTFAQFRAIYHGGHPHDELETFGVGDVVYIGHVGVIDVDAAGAPWVVEAIINPGNQVRRIRYTEWPHLLEGDLIWQGRLKEHAPVDRALIGQESAKYVGRPYKFFDFDLDDDSGFYCSKLAWLSIYRSLSHLEVDDEGPDRMFWFSPKQMINLPRIDVINRPLGEFY